MPHTVEDHRYN